jgi:NAD(P)-dependent dehydrogenase (short-subunit alcohol dehydrogenase family)
MLVVGCSEMNDPSQPQASSNPESAEKTVPYGRAGTPEDIAGTVIFLASRAGAYVNGQFLDVDGGLLLIANGTTKL